MKAELALWRFGLGLLVGGWWAAATFFAAMGMAYAMLTFVMLHPLRLLRGVQPLLDITVMYAGLVFLLLAFAPTALRDAWRKRPLLQLAPGAKRLTSAITRRLIVIAMIALVPAVILRALLWSKLSTDIYETISLSDIALKSYVFVALYFLHVVILMAIMVGPLKLPTRFGWLPSMYGAMAPQGSFMLWLPMVVCAMAVAVTWFRRWLLNDEGTQSRWPQPLADWMQRRTPWSTAVSQRRAARSTGTNAASARVVGLLASRSSVFVTVASVLALVIYMVIGTGALWFGGLSWFLA